MKYDQTAALVLGIESSCDETGVALVQGIGHGVPALLAHALHSQIVMHQPYGGVVPELASRDHIRRVLPLAQRVLQEAKRTLPQVDVVAYTRGPGLAGALLVGAGVACALGAKGFEDGVLAAVNHSGDSDSTGSITGNLLGAIHGVAAIPTRWLDALEARAIIDQVACDLHDALAGRPPTWPSTHGWWDRYPGW